MTKKEIIDIIVDFIDDPYGERPEDFDSITTIENLEEAERYLEDYRNDAQDCENEDAIAAFAEATTEIFIEAWNKLSSTMRYRVIVSNLTDFITENNCVSEYDRYCPDYIDNPPRALPAEFLDVSNLEDFPFYTTTPLTITDLVQIGVNSAGNNLKRAYICFDEDNMCLYSSDNPFDDGILDADRFARFILGSAEALGEFIDNTMDDDDIKTVFGCTKDDIINGVRTVYAVTFMHNTDDPWDETIECSTTDEVADLIESKLADERTLVCDFQKREVAVW